MPLRGFWLSASLFLIVIGLAAGQGVILVLGLLVFLAGVASRLWSRLALERVFYERIFPETRAFAGERLSFTARLTNRKLLPLPWLEVREQVPEELPPVGVRLAPSHLPRVGYISRSTALAWYQRVAWRYELDCRQRGSYHVGPARLQTSDVFGLFPVVRDETARQRVVVYPNIVPLPDLGLPSQRPVGERRGGVRIYEDPLRIVGLRDYQPGDPMHRIDWKASARSARLQSRLYEPASTLHLLVALNLSTFPEVWAGYDPVLFERAVTVAASLAADAYDKGFAVGILANGSLAESNRSIKIAPGRHPRQLMRILEALAAVGPFIVSPMMELLQRESYSFPMGTTLVMVTALLPDNIKAVLNRIAEAGHRVVVVSVTEEDAEGAFGRVGVQSVGKYMRQWEMRQA